MGWKIAETISNLGIVTEVKFSYTLLGDHHKTPEILAVCFKCTFISDITNLLFLKPGFSNFFSGGETYQLKCLAFWGSLLLLLVLFFFPTLSNLMPPPPSICSFLFLAGFVVSKGDALVSCSWHALVSLLPPVLALFRNASASASAFLLFHTREGADGFLHCSWVGGKHEVRHKLWRPSWCFPQT